MQAYLLLSGHRHKAHAKGARDVGTCFPTPFAASAAPTEAQAPAASYQQFILHTGTPQPETDDTFAFAMTDWDGDGRPDLALIKQRNTGSHYTEVHILSGASDFQEYLLHTSTALDETDGNFAFAMTDWDGDGRPDLVSIKERYTETHRMEVHILAGQVAP